MKAYSEKNVKYKKKKNTKHILPTAEIIQPTLKKVLSKVLNLHFFYPFDLLTEVVSEEQVHTHFSLSDANARPDVSSASFQKQLRRNSKN